MAGGACRHFPPLLRNLVPYSFGNNIAGLVARLFGVHGFAPVLFCFRFHRSTIGIWPSRFKAKERPPTISQGSPGVGCSKMKEAAKHRAAVAADQPALDRVPRQIVGVRREVHGGFVIARIAARALAFAPDGERADVETADVADCGD